MDCASVSFRLVRLRYAKPSYETYSVGQYRLGWFDAQFCVVWWNGTRRHRYRLRTDLESDARIRLESWARDRESVLAKEAKTIGEIFDAYIAHRKLDDKSVEKYEYSWKALNPYFGHLSPSEIDETICHRFRDARLAAGRKIATVWTDLSVLRASVRWAVNARVLAEAPFIWMPAQPDPRGIRLTPKEVQRLIDGAEMSHVRLFIILALATAARPDAILELVWDRVWFLNPARPADTGAVDLYNPLRPRKSKGRTRVPMNDMLREALLEAKKNARTPFVIEWAGMPVKSIKKGFRKAVERAGLGEWVSHPTKLNKTVFVTRITPQVLRHTAASRMAAEGVPMERIAKYLGHTSHKFTQRTYALGSHRHLVDERHDRQSRQKTKRSRQRRPVKECPR